MSDYIGPFLMFIGGVLLVISMFIPDPPALMTKVDQAALTGLSCSRGVVENLTNHGIEVADRDQYKSILKLCKENK